MDRKRSIIRAGAVLAVALAAGHLVQTMTADQQQVAAAPAAKPTEVTPTSAGEDAGAAAVAAKPVDAVPAAAALTPDEGPVPPTGKAMAEPATDLAALTDDPALPLLPTVEPPVSSDPPRLAEPAAPAPLPEATASGAAPDSATAKADCTPRMSLMAAPQAMISVVLSAPCHADHRVTLRHAGLAVAEQLDAAGALAIDIPALSTGGEVSVLFADATILRDAVPMPDAASVQRLAVQWMAGDTFQLHALEAAATYGAPGHVWADQPVSPHGGYLVSLGNPDLDLPMMAEVYTWPADAAVPVLPSIEAVVTETTCGRELLGETLHAAAGKTTVRDLSLSMPGCDALGDILVLNNLFPDMTLAAAN